MIDIIFHNANIITLDTICPQAQTIAIEKGRIARVERDVSIHKLIHSKTEVIDCKGKTILPGFIDSHCHLHAYAESLVTLNISPMNNIHSISDIQSSILKIYQQIASGSWIRAKGYNEFYLSEKRHPTRWDIDAVAPNIPVKLSHRSGHAHVLNSLAMNIVGITNETPEPPGGLIDRDLNTGEPTGILYEMGDFLSERIPSLERKDMQRGIRIANRKLLSLGITSIQDVSSRNNLEQWDNFNSWKREGSFKPRICMSLGMEAFKKHNINEFPTYTDKGHLSINGVKIIVDETTGLLYPSQSELNEMVWEIHSSGSQAVLHVIEETAVESACIAIEQALNSIPKLDHRHRLEHCSVCPESLSKRIASLGIMVVTQPAFVYYNGDRYLNTVPDHQLRNLYPIGTLMKYGVNVAASSDFPITNPGPLIGISAAVSRNSDTGNSLLPEEGISHLEALKMFTINAAKCSFEENDKGSIAPGKLADLVVLSHDPLVLPPDEIRDIKVEMTVINGDIVFNNS
ncbi:MAG: amidohydrolase [Spirochaetota bacterium]|nr:amidohydrolase [Spirochaetota bacterium]